MQTYHILLIEDDLSIVENLTAYLTAESFSVVSASGQDQALSLLETFHPDLVLLDITLAQGNGYSTCTAIKKDFTNSGHFSYCPDRRIFRCDRS